MYADSIMTEDRGRVVEGLEVHADNASECNDEIPAAGVAGFRGDVLFDRKECRIAESRL
jgi:hypothetical protein